MVTIEHYTPWSELEDQVRQTQLLMPRDGEPVYPYEDATIELAQLSYDEVRPSALYVLRENLATQSEIAHDIRSEGFHPLALAGRLALSDGHGTTTGLVPPIVEVNPQGEYQLLDGAHRTGRGRWEGLKSFTAILISGVRADCPPYAGTNSWEEIRILEDVPANPAEKKHYLPDYRSLYRDFSKINGSKLRDAPNTQA